MAAQPEQAAIQAASDTMAINYTSIVALVLLSYDTLLTISHEIEYVWNKTFKLGTALYFLARYSMLLSFSLQIFGEFSNFTSPQACNGIVHFVNAVTLLPSVGIQGLLLAQAYAVSNRKRVVLGVLGVLGGCAITSILAIAILDGCDITSAQLHTVRILDDVDVIVFILFDTIVIVVTLAGTLGTWRVYQRSAWNKRWLTHLLAQHSLMRFGFVLILTLADTIVLSALRVHHKLASAAVPLQPLLQPTLSPVLSQIQNSLSAIIMCRFYLDLQRRNAHPNSTTSRGIPTSSLGSFRAATHTVHDAVMAEFSGSPVDEGVGTEASRDGVDSRVEYAGRDGRIQIWEDYMPATHMPSTPLTKLYSHPE